MIYCCLCWLHWYSHTISVIYCCLCWLHWYSHTISVIYCCLCESTDTVTLFLWYTVACVSPLIQSLYFCDILLLVWVHWYTLFLWYTVACVSPLIQSHYFCDILLLVLTPLLQSHYFCDTQYCADSTAAVPISIWQTVLFVMIPLLQSWCFYDRQYCFYINHISLTYSIACADSTASHHVSLIYRTVCDDLTITITIFLWYTALFVMTWLLQSPYFYDIPHCLWWLDYYNHHISMIYRTVCDDLTITITIFLWYTALCVMIWLLQSPYFYDIPHYLWWLDYYNHHISMTDSAAWDLPIVTFIFLW